MRKILSFLFLIFSWRAMAEPPILSKDVPAPVTNSQWIKARYFELGVSIGTPAGLNVCIGYWFDEKQNYLMTQFCMMHFGSTLHGLQFDVGKALYRHKYFRLFSAFSVRNSHMNSVGTEMDFFGVGPYLGAIWDKVSLEIGLYVGSGRNVGTLPFIRTADASSGMTVQLGFQFGFKKLFWQSIP